MILTKGAYTIPRASGKNRPVPNSTDCRTRRLAGWTSACFFLLLLVVAPGAKAADIFLPFDLVYTSAGTASATGQIVLDETLLPNPGSVFSLDVVQSLTLTITGASTGNGTYTLPDFSNMIWDTNGATLDLTRDLVGQPTPGLPWGTPNGGGGDFNLFSLTPDAPNGFAPFVLTTSLIGGDTLTLSHFTPADAVPEPSTTSLVVVGLAAVWLAGRRRFAATTGRK